MKSFKVAIIDSGVDFSHTRLLNCKKSGICIIHDKGSIQYEENYIDEMGHGTAIAGIIHRIIPAIEIVAVKLSACSDIINEKLLCEGIRWCIDQNDIKIINISLGIASRTPYPVLFELCNECFSKGIYICASSHNMPGYECYPACFSSVFGITSGYIKNKLEYGYIDNSNINIIAKGTTQRLAWSNGGYKISSGNSFATAHFSGILAQMLSDHADDTPFPDIYQLIKSKAKDNIRLIQYVKSADRTYIPKKIPTEEDGERIFSLKQNLSFVSKVALFPICEKEIGTVINFRELCPFTITKYYDYPRSFNFFNQSNLPEPILISNRIIDSDFEQFDTIVIGYFLDQMFDANILFGYELIEKSIQNNKNFIIWDINVHRYIKERLRSPENQFYSGQIYIPAVNNAKFENVMHFRYLPNVSVPVILVVGTSNKQGKITTQMRLKEVFMSEGYKVAHISTEPQGSVLGADFVFPYGHQSTISINEDLWGKFISVAMKGVEKYNSPHIIITGTQGKFIPRSHSASELSNEGMLSSLHYMSGVLPDGIICAINPQDTIEMIQNVTKTIAIFSNAKLLFYVMTPWLRNYKQGTTQNTIATHQLLTKEEMTEKMSFFQSQLGLPVIDIMDRGNNTFILEIIENTFAKRI